MFALSFSVCKEGFFILPCDVFFFSISLPCVCYRRTKLYEILYYSENADDIITSDTIKTAYTLTPPTALPFKAVVHSLEGDFIEIRSLTDGLIQLCDTTEDVANAAYIFGTYYSYSVSWY